MHARRSPRRDVRTVDTKRNVAKDELQELSAQCLSGVRATDLILTFVKSEDEVGNRLRL